MREKEQLQVLARDYKEKSEFFDNLKIEFPTFFSNSK
jgi:hypothetical protein